MLHSLLKFKFAKPQLFVLYEFPVSGRDRTLIINEITSFILKC